MQSASSRIWTRVAVSISYDDNHSTTGTRKGWYTIKPNNYIHISNSLNLLVSNMWSFYELIATWCWGT